MRDISWDQLTNGLYIFGCAEAICYAVKAGGYLYDKFLEPSEYQILDPIEKKINNKFLFLPTPLDFYLTYRTLRKLESEGKKHKHTKKV